MYKTIFILFLAATMFAVAAMASAQDPVAWYKFDENTGTTAADASVNGNTATLEAGASWSTDVYTGPRVWDFGPSCVSFTNVATGMVSAPDIAATNMGTGNLTVSLMAKFATDYVPGKNSVLVLEGPRGATDGVGHYNFYFNDSDKNFRCEVADGSNVKGWCQFNGMPQLGGAGPNFFTGEWIHLAYVVDRTATNKVVLFANGEEVTATRSITWNNPASIDSAGVGLTIGNAPLDDRALTGLIDDVRIYNRALSQSELQDMYPLPTPTPTNTPTPSPCASVHWEIFD